MVTVLTIMFLIMIVFDAITIACGIADYAALRKAS